MESPRTPDNQRINSDRLQQAPRRRNNNFRGYANLQPVRRRLFDQRYFTPASSPLKGR